MAFNILPIEINQNIARYIVKDHDLESFRRTCWAAKNAVDDTNSSFWRMRFLLLFDPPAGTFANRDLKRLYRHRQRVLQDFHVSFYVKDAGHASAREEARYVKVLLDMIKESFNGSPLPDHHGCLTSRNLVYLHQCILPATPLTAELFARHRDPPAPLAIAQLMCAHASLSLSARIGGKLRVWGFVDSQRAVYADPAADPLFLDGPGGSGDAQVNVHLLLHVLNFFTCHVRAGLQGGERVLMEAFAELEAEERPRAWQGKLGSEEMGEKWVGTYAYLDRAEILRIRSGARDEIFMDKNIDEESPFQELTLEFSENAFWPPIFESHLPSGPPLPRSSNGDGAARAQQRPTTGPELASARAVCFDGDGYDWPDRGASGAHNLPRRFHSSGRATPLPPQHGVPGWRRVVMMKYYRDRHGDVEENSLWAYEGVLLPGGQVMLGRWWCAEQVGGPYCYSGPFIFWNVD